MDYALPFAAVIHKANVDPALLSHARSVCASVFVDMREHVDDVVLEFQVVDPSPLGYVEERDVFPVGNGSVALLFSATVDARDLKGSI